MYRESSRLVVRTLALEFDDLPKSFDGYRIIFASDFHVRRIGPYERRVLDTLGALHGDLLILGGDFPDHRKKSADAAMAFVDEIGNLAPNFRDGIVAVRGNHDSPAMRKHLKHHGVIRYLSGRVAVVERGGATIALAGARRWPKRKDRDRLGRSLRRLAASMPADAGLQILVAHWPDYFPAARNERFDLVLAGDTHGGQVRLPLIGAIIRKTPMPQRYAYGLAREGRTTLYTTSGVGTRGIRLRFLCPPEIVALELHARDSAIRSEDAASTG